MAQNPQISRKIELQAKLERSRAELSRDFQGLRSDLDVQTRVRHAITHNRTAWMTGAAIFGWVLSRLPARKKQVSSQNGNKALLKDQLRAGIVAALLKFGASLIKPAIAAYASKKISGYVARR